MLSKKQKYAIEKIELGKNVFLTGPAGSGKSYIIEKIKNIYKEYKSVYVTSSTGVSAINIGGRTLHSWAGVGLGKGEPKILIKKIKKNFKAKTRWRNVDILVIDEISMISPSLFDKLEEIARIMRKNNRPFGGIQLIITGDFCQLPVVKETDYCFEAKTWAKCINETISFTEIFRQKDKNHLEFIGDFEGLYKNEHILT